MRATSTIALVLLFASGCDCSGPTMPVDGGPLPGDDGAIDAPIDRPDAVRPDAPDLDAGPTCATTSCDPGERCEIVAGAPACAPNTCEDLACSPLERCVPAPVGMGNVCVDNTCTDSLECATEEHCDGTVCVPDVCTPGASTCDGMGVSVCDDDGGGTGVAFTCGGDAYFESACTTDASGAFCPCEDDWDCPAYTACEVGRCVGTGAAPTCRLDPIPFADALPVNEIQWGGVGAGAPDNLAAGRPFPSSSQSSSTPIVVELDDDNGDGRIDELDVPEIVFLTYCASDISQNGVLRAIHGGGPRRGQDYFAVLGTTVWREGDDVGIAGACATGDLNSTAVVAAGDLDGDGVPEIVAATETAGLRIYANDGTPIAATAANQWTGYTNPAVTIANLDHAGLAEIVVGRHVFTLERPAGMPIRFVDRFSGALMSGSQGQGPIACVANVAGGDEDEVVAGSTVYRLPAPPPGVTRRSECAGGATDRFCLGQLDVVWDAQTVNGATLVPAAQRDGFCAVADVLGIDEVAAPSPSNPLDGTPEVVLIADGHLIVYDGATGTRLRFLNLGAGTDGGAPNVDDFDGDGFPEIGTAFGARYLMIDLQPATAMCPAWPAALVDGMPRPAADLPRTPPAGACATDADCGDPQFACNETIGACVCLHNGWGRITEDDSSRVTGSTVFDFNGDGAAEIVYNDECFFRVYDGLGGDVLFKQPSPSRTRIENPVVADVDNDGNAEIVFPSNNEASLCSSGVDHPNGIAVWGDASDTWVSARRVWNEHAYHVTNVLESGAIPVREPESWRVYAGRSYDTYRSQPRSYGAAPNLAIDRVQASSPDAACGTLGTSLDLAVRVVNRGDLRVGPGVVLTFYGEWTTVPLSEPLYADAAMTPLTATLGTTIEPGGTVIVAVTYAAANNAPGVLPDRVRVVIDEADVERECIEDDNALAIDVDPGSTAPDLSVELGAIGGTCPVQTFATTVRNVGSAPASGIVVRYYAGDPGAGGTPIHDEVVPGTLAAGASTTFTATIDPFPPGGAVTVHAVVDPDDAIAECNDGNNRDATDDTAQCSIIF